MMDMLAWFVFAFLLLRLLVALVNFFSGLYLPEAYPESQSLLSVLIPARNEENNIIALLQDLSVQTYTKLEVLVYDDNSTDNTYSLVAAFAAHDPRFRVIRGTELPVGWLGKPHACHCLGQAAKGEFFLFLDADVRISKQLIQNALSFIQKEKLSLVSIFPQQSMAGLGERLVVPLMNWILLSLLPLRLVRTSTYPSLAAANGQFMFFRGDHYREMRWHEQLKAEVVEDIKISRLLKTRGYRMATLLGNQDITCRMYTSWQEALHGFSKNALQFFGGSRLGLLVFVALTLGGFLPILITGNRILIMAYFTGLILLRVIISQKSRQSIFHNLVFHILQMLTFGLLAAKAMYVSFSVSYQWKGRNIKMNKSHH